MSESHDAESLGSRGLIGQRWFRRFGFCWRSSGRAGQIDCAVGCRHWRPGRLG